MTILSEILAKLKELKPALYKKASSKVDANATPRKDWDETFQKMHEAQHDRLLLPDVFEDEIEPMSMDEFNKRIDHSEDDYKNGKFIEANDLLKSVETWK